GIDYRAAYHAIAQGSHAQPGVGENRMVRDVEELGAKLQVRALGKAKLLHRREVPVDNTRADDGVAAGIAIAELRIARQSVHNRREVEKVARILLAPVQVRVDADVVRITAAVVVLNAA